MRLLLIILCLGVNLNAENLYETWLNFHKESAVQQLKHSKTSDKIVLNFGESFEKVDSIRLIQIKHSEVVGDTLKLFINFPQVIYDIEDAENQQKGDYQKVKRGICGLNLDPQKDYKVELYGSKSVQTPEGKVISPPSSAVKFAEYKIFSHKVWIALQKKKFEISNSAGMEFTKLLETPLNGVAGKMELHKAAAELKKALSANGYDLVFMGQQNLTESEQPEINFNQVKYTVYDLIISLASYSNLCFRIGQKSVIIASKEAFELSKSIKEKKNLNLPGLKVDPVKQVMAIDAEICLSGGILEYLMCLPHSFEHESIFLTKIKPELIHMGLLLIGSEALPVKDNQKILDKQLATKSTLEITVEWKNRDKMVSVPLHRLLIDRSKKEQKNNYALNSWYFSGSYFTENNVYAANLHKSVISLQQNPSSVITYGEVSEDPYRSENSGFEVNEKLCPPTGTTVNIVIKKR